METEINLRKFFITKECLNHFYVNYIAKSQYSILFLKEMQMQEIQSNISLMNLLILESVGFRVSQILLSNIIERG